MAISEDKIRRIYIKNGFNDELMGYNIGMTAENVEYFIDAETPPDNLQHLLHEHFGSYVFTEQGAHGIRYWGGNLSVIKIDSEGKPIINPETGEYEWYDIPIGGGIDLKIGPPQVTSYTTDKHTGKINWLDPEDVTLPDKQVLIKWAGTVVVKGTTGFPTTPEEGTIIRTTTRENGEKNIYSINPFEIPDLEYNTQYYYSLFSYRLLSNGDRVYSDQYASVLLEPKRIQLTEIPSQRNVLIYNGLPQRPELDNYSEESFTITGGTIEAVNGRSYTFKVKPNADYEWADNIESDPSHKQDEKEVVWTINPATVLTPNVSNTELTYMRNTDGAVSQGPTIENFTPEAITITDGEKENVGNYTLILTLKNTDGNTNYTWADGLAPKSYAWSINIKKVTIPSLSQQSFDYTGNEITVNVLDCDDNYVTKTGISQTNAGQYYAIFELKGNTTSITNCVWDDSDESSDPKSKYWEIKPKKVNIPTVPAEGIDYDGAEHDIEPSIQYESDYCRLTSQSETKGTNAGSYTLFFELKNTAQATNYIWVDDTSTDKKVQWKINKIPNDGWTLKLNYKNGAVPYRFYNGCAVRYKDKIHILGGEVEGTSRLHYVYDGMQWLEEEDLPYDFYKGSAVVHNDKIYIIGSASTNMIEDVEPSITCQKACYSWNEEDGWTKEIDLPYEFYFGCAVVCNDKLYLLGGGGTSTTRKYARTWDFINDSWQSIANLSYVTSTTANIPSTAVVYDNKIYITGLGSSSYYKLIYTYNEATNTWGKVSNITLGTQCSKSVSYKNKLYFFSATQCYSWAPGETAISSETSPFDPIMTACYGESVATYGAEDNEKIHILGGGTTNLITSATNYHFSGLRGETLFKWDLENNEPPVLYKGGGTVVYKDKIHILGGNNTGSGTGTKNHYVYDGTKWTKLEDLPYTFLNGSIVVYNNRIYLLGGEGSNNIPNLDPAVAPQQACFSWDDENGWRREPNLPYIFYNGAALVYNNQLYIMGGGNSTTTKKDIRYLKVTTVEGATVYEWDTVTYTDTSGTVKTLTLPPASGTSYLFSNNCATVYNNKIYLLYNYLIFSGDLTSPFTQAPLDSVIKTTDSFSGATMIVYNDKIHIFGGKGNSPSNHVSYYTAPLLVESTLPDEYFKNSIIIYKNKLTFVGKGDIYVYNETSPSWNSYGDIVLNTISQEILGNATLEIEDNVSEGVIHIYTDESKEIKLSDYCEIKKLENNKFILELNNTLLETSQSTGAKAITAAIQIDGDNNHYDSKKEFPINLIGITVALGLTWGTRTDKQLEAMIRAKDYRDNKGKKLQVLDLNDHNTKVDFDLKKYFLIDGESRTIRNPLALASATGTPVDHDWRILDFKTIIQDEKEIPLMIIGMTNVFCTAKETTVKNLAGDKTTVNNVCNEFYDAFPFNYLTKERTDLTEYDPSIGKIFLPSEIEMAGSKIYGPAEDGSSPYLYYFDYNAETPHSQNWKKTAGSKATATGALTNGYWTRTEDISPVGNVSYITSTGTMMGNEVATSAKAYSMITSI